MTKLFDFKEIKTGTGTVKTQNKKSAIPKNKTGKIKNIETDIKLCLRYQRVSQAIGKIKMGENIHYASMGEWSNHDLLFHLLDQTGPADIYFCTWSVSENAVRLILSGIKQHKINKLVGVLDWRVKVRRPEILSFMQYNFAHLRLTSCHAKVFVLISRDEKYKIAVVGSANFTNNPRIEAGVVCCDEKAAEFHKNWIMSEYEKGDPFQTDNVKSKKGKVKKCYLKNN